jgi:hypothetical protein
VRRELNDRHRAEAKSGGDHQWSGSDHGESNPTHKIDRRL